MPALSQRQWNLLLVIVLLAGSLLVAVTRVRPDTGASALAARIGTPSDPAPLPDHPAPDLALPQLDGAQLTLRDLRGQVVLINVWATWCPPCRAEMPAIQQAYATYRDRGFVVLAVNQREDASAIAPLLEQYGLTFPVLLDRDGQASASYQANVLPSSFFVDWNGVIRAVYRGPMPSRVIVGTVEQLLRERPRDEAPCFSGFSPKPHNDGSDKGRKMNQKLSQWARDQFERYVHYKVRRFGCTISYLPEDYSTRTCSRCGHVHTSAPRGRVTPRVPALLWL